MSGPEGEASFTPDWLALREGADAAARSTRLLTPLRAALPRGRNPGGPPLVVHDLGCGTGSMGRWLVPRLPGPQHWVLHDRDPALLARARAGLPARSADGGRVTAETRTGDLVRLRAADVRGADLVTASALLDLLTAPEAVGLAQMCAAAGCPALLTLSVAGRVEPAPARSLDGALGAAFDAHQRRPVGGRRLLGPDAPGTAADAFRRCRARVHEAPSPWSLGPADAALAAEWLRGWVAAAVEQRPELAAEAEAYLHERLAQCAAGRFRVLVDHRDLLAVPPSRGR
ncbi:methyltransferase domain-containing protein [Streptomonospora litoralis]|uniref:Methyltransferase domain protein n=1 Tax=Streptomonospora litoralis TaxID=2498135 RepID=A0A4P6QB22_9ACTN|nr:class I SAM-dependent methyltransferase [Streptomonospora litoralis]QBI56557.1 Methyltransferase domain protein [Streptomonospora litoralis]